MTLNSSLKNETIINYLIKPAANNALPKLGLDNVTSASPTIWLQSWADRLLINIFGNFIIIVLIGIAARADVFQISQLRQC